MKIKTKKMLRNILTNYNNGGITYLIFDHLLDKNKHILKITLEELSKELKITRPTVTSSLKLLQHIGVIEMRYGTISIYGNATIQNKKEK